MNTDVEDLLRDGMERFTADLRAPAGIIHRAARRRHRRLVLRSAAGATALTAGAAALVVTTLPGAVRDGASGPAVDTAYVVKQVSNALNAADPGDIAQMTITTTGITVPGGKTATASAEEWSYDKQWRAVTYSSPGHPAYDEGSSASSVYTLVNYLDKTWARQPGAGRPAALPLRSPASKHGCAPAAFASLPVLFRFGLPGIGAYASSTPATVATALRSAVSCGTLDVAGRQQVNGIDAIKLTSRPKSLLSETIWVSPGTYLPVRVNVRPTAGGPGFQQTANITWLPPTAQNLAKLTVSVPAGFRKVTFPRAVTPILAKLPLRLLPKPVAFCPPPSSAGPACKSGVSVPHGFATPVLRQIQGHEKGR